MPRCMCTHGGTITELQRSNQELENFVDKIKDKQEKIKLNQATLLGTNLMI